MWTVKMILCIHSKLYLNFFGENLCHYVILIGTDGERDRESQGNLCYQYFDNDDDLYKSDYEDYNDDFLQFKYYYFFLDNLELTAFII